MTSRTIHLTLYQYKKLKNQEWREQKLLLVTCSVDRRVSVMRVKVIVSANISTEPSCELAVSSS